MLDFTSSFSLFMIILSSFSFWHEAVVCGSLLNLGMVICFSLPILYPGEEMVGLFMFHILLPSGPFRFMQSRISTDLNTSRFNLLKAKYCYCIIILLCCLDIVANFNHSKKQKQRYRCKFQEICN